MNSMTSQIRYTASFVLFAHQLQEEVSQSTSTHIEDMQRRHGAQVRQTYAATTATTSTTGAATYSSYAQAAQFSPQQYSQYSHYGAVGSAAQPPSVVYPAQQPSAHYPQHFTPPSYPPGHHAGYAQSFSQSGSGGSSYDVDVLQRHPAQSSSYGNHGHDMCDEGSSSPRESPVPYMTALTHRAPVQNAESAIKNLGTNGDSSRSAQV